MIDQFDSAVISFVDSWPRWLDGIMHAFSFVGQPAVTITVMAAIGIYGLAKTKRKYTWASIITLLFFGFNSLVKFIVHRNRPSTYIPPEDILRTYSFPSGHAAGSMLAFGLLAYIAWRKFRNPYARIAALSAATLVIIGVSLSRIYIGAHYPSDVVAGLIVGAVGLIVVMWRVKL
jgi:undecaprenyl-diphosphatase